MTTKLERTQLYKIFHAIRSWGERGKSNKAVWHLYELAYADDFKSPVPVQRIAAYMPKKDVKAIYAMIQGRRDWVFKNFGELSISPAETGELAFIVRPGNGVINALSREALYELSLHVAPFYEKRAKRYFSTGVNLSKELKHMADEQSKLSNLMLRVIKETPAFLDAEKLQDKKEELIDQQKSRLTESRKQLTGEKS